MPEIAFSVEARVRRHGVGSFLFTKLIAEARSRGYHSLRITTGAQNQPRSGRSEPPISRRPSRAASQNGSVSESGAGRSKRTPGRYRVGSAATATPLTLASPFPFTTSQSRSTRCSPCSSYFFFTVILVASCSPGQVCLVKRTL